MLFLVFRKGQQKVIKDYIKLDKYERHTENAAFDDIFTKEEVKQKFDYSLDLLNCESPSFESEFSKDSIKSFIIINFAEGAKGDKFFNDAEEKEFNNFIKGLNNNNIFLENITLENIEKIKAAINKQKIILAFFVCIVTRWEARKFLGEENLIGKMKLLKNNFQNKTIDYKVFFKKKEGKESFLKSYL